MLLTRPPLSPKASFDLHVLGTPPAFILSQDQTLQICYRIAPTDLGSFELGAHSKKFFGSLAVLRLPKTHDHDLRRVIVACFPLTEKQTFIALHDYNFKLLLP